MEEKQDMRPLNWEVLSKYFSGESSDEERAQVQAWLKASVSNERYLEQVRKIWEASEHVAVKEPDLQQAWNKVDEAASKKVVPLHFKSIMKIAASLFLIAAVGLVFYLTVFSPKQIIATTQAGEKKEILLADGSKVWLNENSTLEYPEEFGKDLRDVSLKGEAFFKVARDEAKPFLITTGNSVTQVLGTSFNIHQQTSGTVEINVVSGKVSFAGKNADKDKIILTAGEKGELAYSSMKPVKTAVSDPNFLAWHTGNIEFKKSMLREVVATLERLYKKKLIFKNEKLKNCILTSTFNKSSLEDILRTLSSIYNLKFEIKGDVVYLDEGGC